MGVDLGEWIVGLRSNDEEILDLLWRGLAPIRVDDIPVFPNLSLFRSADERGKRELHRLYRRGVTVLRTGSSGRMLRAAARHLDGFLTPPADLLPLRAELLVGGHGAVLVYDTAANLHLPHRRLAKMGWRRTEGAVCRFDPETLEVVVPEPRFAFDPVVAAEIDERWPREPDEGGVAPGRFPVHAVVLLGTRPDHLRVASPARRLASLASLLDTSFHPARAVEVEAVGRLDGSAEVVRALGYEANEVIDILRSLSA